MPRHLRPVGPDERVPEQAGSLPTVIDDLEVAHGHIVEAQAETAACAGDTTELVVELVRADDAVTKAIAAARRVKP